MKTRFLSAALAAMLVPTAQAQIAVGGATPISGGATFPTRIEQNLPGLTQVRNGTASTTRRELGPVMGFCGGSNNGTSATYTSPLDGSVNKWSEKDSWTYDGEMFMQGGTNYTFASLIDDFATITIDGILVLSQASCKFTSGSYLCESSGWHRISIRIWDTGGGYGNNRDFTPGIAYNTKGSTSQYPVALWTQLVDSGDGSLFRTTMTNIGIRVAAQMRESDPTIMDVDYIVYSDSPTVNVRALAFEDGERGFATVVRPETWVEGTESNIGDGIAANVAHRLSWRVSTDWKTDLAKVKFEVMAMEPGTLLLPMHFITIPAAEGHPKTIVSVNDLTDSVDDIFFISSDINQYDGVLNPWRGTYGNFGGHTPLLSALLWLYSQGEEDLSISAGVLRCNGKELVRHSAFIFDNGFTHATTYYNHWTLNPNAIDYVFNKMGYRLLKDSSEIAWINENTRCHPEPLQFRQYAVKTVEE